jgi:glycosyltransferase involved in cell wall biosynthesis
VPVPRTRCLFLPNLYDLEYEHKHHHYQPGVLRVASFGALRLLKNHMTSAAAALLIARYEQTNLEFWVSVNREENAGSKGILQAIRNLYQGVTWARLVESPWEEWSAFRRTIAKMDLYLQPSYTETFNITVADAIVEGVPAVVSEAIDWAPDGWKADPDNVEEIARVGCAHLHNPKAAEEGLAALREHVHEGVRLWLKFLGV